MRIAKRDDYPKCKELHPIIDAAREQGWRVELTSGGHLRFLPRDRSEPPVYGPSTPSEYRSVKNVVGKLRRAGLQNV